MGGAFGFVVGAVRVSVVFGRGLCCGLLVPFGRGWWSRGCRFGGCLLLFFTFFLLGLLLLLG